MGRVYKTWEVPPEELHDVCVARMSPYDQLPAQVRQAIQQTRFDIPPNRTAEYVRWLQRGLRTTEEVVAQVHTDDRMQAENQYLIRRLKREYAQDYRRTENLKVEGSADAP